MLELSLAVGDYDRTRAILDGRVRIEGCETHTVSVEPEEAFHRAFKFKEFDISEISLGSHTVVTGRGESEYVGVPAFVLRVFRHSYIYIRTDRGITSPADLKGRLVGLPEYQLTANVWLRGIFQDEYGIAPKHIKWRSGGIEEPGRGERSPITVPAEVDFQPIPQDRTLSDMLEKGDLDAIWVPRPPSCVLRGAPKIGRLFPDYVSAEQAYFAKTKIFPIMHLIGVRRSLAEKYPWLPVSVFKAFIAAKQMVKERNTTMLPWATAEYNKMRALMGEDYWSYHVEPNRHVLETFTRYAHEQGMTARKVDVEELFAPSTMQLSKI
jgi:4,5-dihydroxyphthalate decarboxylase